MSGAGSGTGASASAAAAGGPVAASLEKNRPVCPNTQRWLRELGYKDPTARCPACAAIDPTCTAVIFAHPIGGGEGAAAAPFDVAELDNKLKTLLAAWPSPAPSPSPPISPDLPANSSAPVDVAVPQSFPMSPPALPPLARSASVGAAAPAAAAMVDLNASELADGVLPTRAELDGYLPRPLWRLIETYAPVEVTEMARPTAAFLLDAATPTATLMSPKDERQASEQHQVTVRYVFHAPLIRGVKRAVAQLIRAQRSPLSGLLVLDRVVSGDVPRAVYMLTVTGVAAVAARLRTLLCQLTVRPPGGCSAPIPVVCQEHVVGRWPEVYELGGVVPIFDGFRVAAPPPQLISLLKEKNVDTGGTARHETDDGGSFCDYEPSTVHPPLRLAQQTLAQRLESDETSSMHSRASSRSLAERLHREQAQLAAERAKLAAVIELFRSVIATFAARK